MLLSLVLGDGCLHYINTVSGQYGGLTISHCNAQSDYQEWKAKLVSEITGRTVKTRVAANGSQRQISVCMKRFRAWRKFTYPSNKKDVSKILPFITNPHFAAAVWLMDDGYVEPSYSTLADGTKVNYGARFRIYSCETPVSEQQVIIDWFKTKLDVEPRVKMQKSKLRGKSYPFLKFSQEDSLKLWKEIREFVLQFDSMKYKFRHIEQIYQKKMLQP